jgi:hypothetical protein
MHRFKFSGKTRAVIICEVHAEERQLVKPQDLGPVVAGHVRTGDWVGDIPPEAEQLLRQDPPRTPPPTTRPANGEAPAAGARTRPASPENQLAVMDREVVEILLPNNDKRLVSAQMFKSMILPEASTAQALYCLWFCAHNQLDPFANEVYFAIMDNKPVIQVAKSVWDTRAEEDPRLLSWDDGIIVETTPTLLRNALLTGNDTEYILSELLRGALIKSFEEGKPAESLFGEQSGTRLLVDKRSVFLSTGETLKGGWSVITVSDRPIPYVVRINLDGWEMKNKQGDLNNFWREKAPYMINKTARKRCAAKAFPRLSGLLAAPEKPETPESWPPTGQPVEQLESAPPANGDEPRAGARGSLRGRIFAVGAEIPAPFGPFRYPELHELALMGWGKGISQLTYTEMLDLGTLLDGAKANAEQAETLWISIQEVLHARRENEQSPEQATGAAGEDQEQPGGGEPQTGSDSPV